MLNNKDVSLDMLTATDTMTFESFLNIVNSAFKADGFRGVMQTCGAVLDGYDAALAACEERAMPDNACLATAATHLSLGLLVRLGAAIEAELEKQGIE